MPEASPLTAGDFLNSTGEFVFLKAKINAQDTERRRLEEELTKSRIDGIRRAEAGRRAIANTEAASEQGETNSRKNEGKHMLFTCLFSGYSPSPLPI